MNIGKLPKIETLTNELEYAQCLSECSKKPSVFAEDFLGLDVFDYNKAFLDCQERFICYRTGRQVGKSRNAAIKAIHFGYFAPLFAKNLDEGECNIVIASVSKDQAFLIFRKIANFVHKSPTLMKNRINETKTELSLKWYNGEGVTNFIVRPIGDTGDSLRGWTTHFAILDEAAYIPQRVFDAFLASTVTTRPKILLTSTPRFKAGAFFNACEHSYVLYEKGIPQPREVNGEIAKKGDKYMWAQFHVTTHDNPLAKSDPAILKLIRSVSKGAEKQEIEGEFLEGGNSIIAYNLLQEALLKIPRPRFSYYEASVDTSGKGSDETVFITYGVTENGMLCPIDVYTEITTDQIELAKTINKWHKIYNYRRIYIDSTGIGDTLVDACKHLNPALPIYGINFKAEKVNLYVNLERLFEERLINLSLLPEFHMDKMAEQLSYMYWEYGKDKNQPPKVRSDHEDDYSDSGALGAFGQEKGEEIQYIPEELFTDWY